MELEDFLSKLDRVKQMPSGFSARCPAHEDRVASLSVNAGKEGGIVVMCHAGCATENVVAALGLEMGDLAGKPHVIATYPYYHEDGQLLWVVERWANPKTFRCRPGLPPEAQRVLYRADALAWARGRGATIFIPEGEKDANRLGDLGLVSTTNVGGAKAWLPHYAGQLAGCPVVVIADTDPVGIAHAREVAESARTTASSVVIVRPRYGKDVSELLDLGWTLDALESLPEDDELGSVTATNVMVRPIDWAWDGYIPLGKVTAWGGDPGDGKSLASTDLTARWSSGAPMPDATRHAGPWPVVMISAEDDPEDTIVPRLRIAGGDLSKIHLVTRGSKPNRPFDITKDMAALARLVLKTGAKVVVLDPIMAFVGADTETHNDASVRQALFPLYRLAQDTGCAVLIIRHLNKGSGKAIYRGGGSIAFTGAVRAEYTIGRDPENPGRRVMASVKMNIAVEPPSLAFSIESTDKGPFIKWHGKADATAQEVMDGFIGPDVKEILEFLDRVVENGEPMSWHAIVLAGKKEGFTEKQLRTRRPMSRLIKITGHEGNRSTRWGYLEHQVFPEADPHLPEDEATFPSSPHIPKYFSGSGGQEDGEQDQADDHMPENPSHLFGKEGAGGESGPPHGQMAPDSEEVAEEQLIADLEALPLACDVCGTEVEVSRWAGPWWVIRCTNHNPLTYGGGQ